MEQMPREYAVKVELDPTPEQAVFLRQLAEDRRLGWNELVIRRKSEYQRARDFREMQETRGVHGPTPPSPTRFLADVRRSFPPQGGRWPTALDRPIDDALALAWKVVKRGGGLPQIKTADHPRQSFKWQYTRFDAAGLKVPLHSKSPISYKEDPTPRMGKVKWATVSLDVDRWYVSFGCEGLMPEAQDRLGDSVGIDLNTHACVASDGRRWPIPSALAAIEARVARQQHELARYRDRRRRAGAACGSKRYKLAMQRLGKTYRRMRNVRADWLHKVTTEIVHSYTRIVIEDLRVANMVRSAKGTLAEPGRNVRAKAGLSRKILNAAFSEFRRQLEYKSKWYGCEIITVNPAYTSRTCSQCQYVNEWQPTKYRDYVCESCGYEIDRDDNAAINIKFRGRESLEVPAGSRVMDAESHKVDDEASNS